MTNEDLTDDGRGPEGEKEACPPRPCVCFTPMLYTDQSTKTRKAFYNPSQENPTVNTYLLNSGWMFKLSLYFGK